MFIDEAKIYVKAGDGGDGCMSFHKDRYHRYPVPNGGPGGKGGDVRIVADENVETLLDFHYRHNFIADRGGHGSSNNKKGRYGADAIMRVPPGTLIRAAGSGDVLRDLARPGDEVTIVKGGHGGRGNGGCKMATRGVAGESRNIVLELRLIADVGIIGYPNAGKSTLLGKISSATPKIANYPFTTKDPVLGVVRLYSDSRPFVVAEIPGLIEGAHSGKGLGDRFLRHIERTHLLIHLVDISATEGRDPVSDYRTINRELKLYSEELSRRGQVLALNKIDVTGAGENITAFRRKIKKKAYPVSAATGEGIEGLLRVVYKKIEGLKCQSA